MNVPAGTLRAASIARVDEALRRVEAAQNELTSACTQLSALVGAGAMWKSTYALQNRVHSHWERLSTFRNLGRYKLDDLNAKAHVR